MFNHEDFLALEIKNIILTNFFHADIEIIFDKERNEYFISTRNKELYYSESYGMLILEINQNILWKQDFFNFYFILDLRRNPLENMAKNILFTSEETSFTQWNLHTQTVPDDNHFIYNYPLAA
ncbi:MAG: hypothetical protein LBQ89_03180 [Treponema sp.]|jgi:hypothetical protein|nr:hypothetical protein [Treponema sp.]